MAWLLYALLSSVLVALSTIFNRIGLRSADEITIAFINSTIATLFLLITGILFKKINMSVFQEITSSSMFVITLGGIAMGLSWVFYLIALRFGLITHVIAIYYMSIVFIMILGMLFLGDTISLKAILGSLLIIIGAYLMML